MVEDMTNNMFKFPKYRPENIGETVDSQNLESSPEKADRSEEELKVYDGSRTSSSLATDPSMRDYDYMIEPDQFNFYLPPASRKPEQEKMGDGLGVVGNFIPKTTKLFGSIDSQEEPAARHN